MAPATLATALTGLIVGIGLLDTEEGGVTDVLSAPASGATTAAQLELTDVADRQRTVSRSAPRVELEPEAVGKQYATADVNLRAEPTVRSAKRGVVEQGSRVAITGKVIKGWAEVLLEGRKVRYINAEYLADEKPVEATATGGSSGSGSGGGVSSASCPDGSSTESGLTSTAVTMFRAVCNAFPPLSVYGGYDPHGEHIDGRAVDFMTYEDQALGWAVANWARAHAGELQIRTIIFAQRIWNPERSSEGWRWMEDRGSTTANHYDHPHISVY